MSDGQFYPLEDKEVPYQLSAVRGTIVPGCSFKLQEAAGNAGQLALFDGFPGSNAVCLKVFKTSSEGMVRPPVDIKREVDALKSQHGLHAPAYVCLGRAVFSGGKEYWALVQESLNGYQTREDKVNAYRSCNGDNDAIALDELLGVVYSIARAIASIHESGHVHRDLSPKNIMVEARRCLVPDVKVIDFGQANIRNDFAGTINPNALIHGGTPGFSSPEVFDAFNRAGRASRATSVYSLGALAFYIMTRDRPYDGELSAENELWERGHRNGFEHFDTITRIEKEPIPLSKEWRRVFSSSVRMRRALIFIGQCTLYKTALRPTIEECESILGGLVDVNMDGLSRELDLSGERLDILTRAADREFAEGDGSESNLRRVAALASLCADAGSLEAALLAGTSLERLDSKLCSCGLQLTYYRMAADGGLPAGMTSTARMILANEDSTDADRSYALGLLSKANAAGNAFAERLLRRYS